MTYQLPELPYARDGLAPHISKDTLDYHYGKHHQAYVNKFNEMTAGTAHEGQDPDAVSKASYEPAKLGQQGGLYNNAAQTWNHTFYWHSMKPQGGGQPSGDLASAIDSAFGGMDGFKKAFTEAGATQFASGWAWLVAKDGQLEIRKTPNAVRPSDEDGATELLTMDVWEHAYYLDYQNARPGYMEAWVENLVNWDFAAENLARA